MRGCVTSAAFRILALSVSAWTSIARAALGGDIVLAQAPASVRCDANASGANAVTFTCPLTRAGEQRYRFVARFSGVHDDTTATMIVTLDREQIGCGPGSKPGFSGEDNGDVTLECRLSLAAMPGTKPVLGVELSWSHAHYMADRT